MFESRTFRDWIGDPPLYDLRDESIPRAVMAIGHDYPPDFELAPHRRRRGQFLYAVSGVVTVSTPEGPGSLRPSAGCGFRAARRMRCGWWARCRRAACC
jgi:hypothetical protein